MDIQIVELSKKPDLIPTAVQYFWKCWGSESNFKFYEDCILNSLNQQNSLPKWYIGIDNNQIVCSYSLLVNDIISRQDLVPWFACLFVNEAYRGRGIAERLLDHGLAQASSKGYDYLYLSSDLENFYERKNWEHYCDGYGVSGGSIKIYRRAVISG